MKSFEIFLSLLATIRDPRRAEGKLYQLPHILLFSNSGGCERSQLLSRHPHVHQGSSAEAERGLCNQLEESARAHVDPFHSARVESRRRRNGFSRSRQQSQ